MKAQPMKDAYRNLLNEVNNNGRWELNERTNTEICMIEGGWSFKLDLSNGKLPVAGNRAYYPHIAAAEVAWQLMGTKDPSFILRKAPKVWEKFIEDGELKTAYGYRWREHFGRDQLSLAIDRLQDVPTDRQLYISAWDPGSDGLGEPGQPKNIPCPVGFSISRAFDKLHMSMFLRSSDIFVGLPYDVMGYALMLDVFAASTGCKPGTLHVTLAHPHFYMPHWDFVKECLSGGSHKGWVSGSEPALPGWTMGEILDSPDQYVRLVQRTAKRVKNSTYSPMPEVIE